MLHKTAPAPPEKPKRKVRFALMIDDGMLDRLRESQERTGLTVAEQIRRGTEWWLEAHRWPADRS